MIYILFLILMAPVYITSLHAKPQTTLCAPASGTLSSGDARCQACHYAEKAAYWHDHIFNEGYTAQMRNTAQKIAHLYTSIAQQYEALINHAPSSRSEIIERTINPLLQQALSLEKAFPVSTHMPETMYEKVRRLEHENAELKKNSPAQRILRDAR